MTIRVRATRVTTVNKNMLRKRLIGRDISQVIKDGEDACETSPIFEKNRCAFVFIPYLTKHTEPLLRNYTLHL